MAYEINDYVLKSGVHADGKLGNKDISGSFHVVEGIHWISGANHWPPDLFGDTMITTAVYENSGAYSAGSSSFETITTGCYLEPETQTTISILSSSYETLEKDAKVDGIYTASIHKVRVGTT